MHSPENIFSKFSHLKVIDVTDVDQLKRLFEELLQIDLGTVEAIEAFIQKRGLLARHLENEAGESYFLMTIDVSNEQWKKRHEYLESEITPLFRVYGEKLNRKFLDSEAAKALPAPFDILRRNWNAEVELFASDNVDLLKQAELIHMEITGIQGKLTARWRGEDVPIPFLYEEMKKKEREIRKEAYEAVREANLTVVDVLDEKFGKLLLLRQRIAENAGCESYTQYRFKEMRRFDWGPCDCFAHHSAVKKHLLPLSKALLERRKEGLNLDTLRPYDGPCDPSGRDPLKIYEKGNSAELIEGAGKIIKAIDPELHGYFKHMRDNGFFDLDARKNKADIGYMYSYPVYEQASVFMNGTGLSQDLMVFLHELGHCFHYFIGKGVEPYFLQSWNAEVAEVGSMAMEHMGLEQMHAYLSSEQVDRIKEDHLRITIGGMLFLAQGDEFQHWIYAHPNHSIDERRQKWLELADIYAPGWDRSGYEESIAKTGWQFLHILQLPFYMIDYSISNILALTLWDRYKNDPADAIDHYKRGCALAGSRTVPEIYEAFGSRFSFGEDVIAPLARRLRSDLKLDGVD